MTTEATANQKMVAGAIDLGSNSFRLLVVQLQGGAPTVISKDLATVRLGRGLAAAGKLAPEAISRGLATLAGFRAEMLRFRVQHFRCCGTEALRQAANRDHFLVPASELLGQKIEIISGHEEALLSCRGVLASLPAKAQRFPLLIVDVGGSSTELSLLESFAAPPRTISIPDGAASFTELAVHDCLSPALLSFRKDLEDFLGMATASHHLATIVGAGGTATSLAALNLSLANYDPSRVHGHYLHMDDINKLASRLTDMSTREKESLPALDEGRGNIILAGLQIYKEILATIGVEGMIVSDSGLLEGIMFSCFDST